MIANSLTIIFALVSALFSANFFITFSSFFSILEVAEVHCSLLDLTISFIISLLFLCFDVLLHIIFNFSSHNLVEFVLRALSLSFLKIERESGWLSKEVVAIATFNRGVMLFVILFPLEIVASLILKLIILVREGLAVFEGIIMERSSIFQFGIRFGQVKFLFGTLLAIRLRGLYNFWHS